MPSLRCWPRIVSDGVLIVVGLAGFWSGPSASLGSSVLVGFGAAIYLMARGRSAPLVLLLLGSPFSALFGAGAVEYSMGRATLMSSGKPRLETFNLDTFARCPSSTSGCFVTGGEWVVQLPYNAAVLMLTVFFGPMPGTYRGPYPQQGRSSLAFGDEGRSHCRRFAVG
jgi:hypothetical protein